MWCGAGHGWSVWLAERRFILCPMKNSEMLLSSSLRVIVTMTISGSDSMIFLELQGCICLSKKDVDCRTIWHWKATATSDRFFDRDRNECIHLQDLEEACQSSQSQRIEVCIFFLVQFDWCLMDAVSNSCYEFIVCLWERRPLWLGEVSSQAMMKPLKNSNPKSFAKPNAEVSNCAVTFMWMFGSLSHRKASY